MSRVLGLLLLMTAMLFAGGEKRAYLPKYIPQTTLTPEVRRFLASSSSDDLLHVSVTYMDPICEDFENEIFYAHRENGVSEIVLNGISYSEESYRDYLSKKKKRPFKPVGYDAYLTPGEILKLESGNEHVYVSVYKNRTPTSTFLEYDSLLRKSKIESNAFSNGYKGNGIGVYFTESGCPSLSNLNTSLFYFGDSCPHGLSGHATGVARILQTTAPRAMVYGFDEHNYPDPDAYTPSIQIGSHSWNVGRDGVYGDEDAKMDNYVYCYDVANFVAAGNKDSITDLDFVGNPALAANVISVGAVDPGNHRFEWYSKWKNSNVGNQKPEVANYTNFKFSGDSTFRIHENNYYYGVFDGTSAATPYTAGLAADLLQQNPILQRKPEILKAYILSMTGRSIYNYYAHDDDNALAAMEVPYYNEQPDAAVFRGWRGLNDCCFSSRGRSIEFTESGIMAGRRYRIVISWLTSGSYILTNGTLSQDIDLFVYQGNQLIEFSNSWNDSFEIVDFVTQSSQDLKIEIYRYSNSGDDRVAIGYSMWHN